MNEPSLLAALALGALVLAAPGSARATAFDFAYSIAPDRTHPLAVKASGILTADPTANPGEFLVAAISGTRNGEAITGLVPPGGFASNDNLIFTASPHLDGDGLSYTVAGAGNDGMGNVNIFLNDDVGYSEIGNDVGNTPTFTLTEIGTVPEPASIAMLGIGLLGLAVAARRRKSR